MPDILLVALGALITIGVVWSRSRYAGFLAQKPEDYAEPTQVFDIKTHLSGPIICEGVIYGPLGRVTSRFVGQFDCTWNGDTGVMREHFSYHDGTEQNREWHLTIGDNGRVKATASDVVGTGLGTLHGDAFRMCYRFRLPESSGGHVMDVVDWMYLAPNGSIVNRSQFRKFGIKMAELVATMRLSDAPNQKAA